MSDLRTYLALPPNHQLYSEGLVLFQRHCMDSHGQHYAQLSSGPFVGNKELLLQCLKQAKADGSTNVPAKPAVVVVHSPETKIGTPKTEAEIELAIQLRKLRQERARTSQQFHGCTEGDEGNDQRAMLCDDIERISKQISATAKKLSHLQQYGYLPKEEEIKPLPDTVDECRKEINRVSSLRLKTERRIEYLLTLSENSRKRKKQLPENQKKLQEILVRWSALRIQKRRLEKANE
ncbi:MAG: hypothetical protein AAFP77_19740 [Bacteroidota bacterium]